MNDSFETLQSKAFDWLRFPLIAFIIFLHFSYENISEAKGLFYYLEYTIGGLLSSIGVPTFFFISGYLFFAKGTWSKNAYISKVKKRIGTLVVPYLIWNTITVLLLLGAHAFKCHSMSEFITHVTSYPWLHSYWDINHFGVPTNWLGFNALIYTPQNLPLWFMRDLFFACLLAPVSHWVVTTFKRYGIVLLCAIFIADIVPQVPGFRFMAFCFFTCGAYFSINRKNTVREFHNHRWFIFPITTLISIVLLLNNNNLGASLPFLLSTLIVVAVPSVILIAAALIKQGWTRLSPLLSSCAFFVYAMHQGVPLAHFMGKINNHLFHTEAGACVQFLHFLFVPSAIILIDSITYCFLRRFLPRLLSLLTGNRKVRNYD